MANISKDWKNYLYIFIGPLMYVLGINAFITPLNLYSGGVIGLCQIARTILENYFDFGNIDFAGILSMSLNIPLLILAFKTVGKRFFVKTCISVVCLNTFLTFFTVQNVIIADTLASCVIGGAIAGIGLGLTLQAGSSTGGADIVGMYLVKKNSKISVGQVNMLIDAISYVLCLILFDMETTIYSIIVSLVISVSIDKMHTQNRKINALIFTDNYDVAKQINTKLKRGSTSWNGKGDYTGNKKYIISTVVSKYEEQELKMLVNELDKNAFVIINSDVDTFGYVEKRLEV